MLQILLPIFLLHWTVLVTPGANVLVVTQLAASGDRRAALFAAAGVVVVAVIWSALAVLGVHSAFEAHATIRRAVQVLGGIYLCWLATRLWRSRAGLAGAAPRTLSAAAAFRMGFTTNIMNPKSALFFGSVFATALPPSPTPALLGATVLLVFVNALVWHVLLALLFSQPRVQMRYNRHSGAVNRIAAALVAGFGVRLVATSAGEIAHDWVVRGT